MEPRYADTKRGEPASPDGKDYDVIVVGGGTAGVIAAVQSAYAGAKTLLLEKTGMLGGTITAGGVNFPGLFHAWGRQIIRGYGWRLVKQCVEECGETLPDFSTEPKRHWHHQIRVNRAVYAMLCDERLREAGADILFHAMPAEISALDDGWHVVFCSKTGLGNISTGCLVDCTGDANAVALAGGKIRHPREECQPGTQICVVGGYTPSKLDLDQINRSLAEAIENGEISPYDVAWNKEKANLAGWLRNRGGSFNHITGINARDSREKTRMEIAGRSSVLRLFRFLRRQPGLENIQIDYLAPECGVRESATIIGDVMISAQDYCSGRFWNDALCYSFYPLDLHSSKGNGLYKHSLDRGVVPTIPRSALLPQGLSHIAVAGRCVSSDRVANSALRVQASAMAMGQVAGAMAALSIQKGVDMRELKLDDIRRILEHHGAIVPAKNI